SQSAPVPLTRTSVQASFRKGTKQFPCQLALNHDSFVTPMLLHRQVAVVGRSDRAAVQTGCF
ncbi:MAG: hypothetical protein ACE5DY_09095, partial [Mariprofundaceae bacterium]